MHYSFILFPVDKLSDKEADFSSLTVERISESEHSQVEMQKYGRQTIIEEIITRIEENEREIIEEKLVGKARLNVYIYLHLTYVCTSASNVKSLQSSEHS